MSAKRPASRAASPSSETATAPSAKRRPWRRASGSSPSRSAASGGTLVERQAGASEETSVTISPIASETITVRVSSTGEVVGRSIPIASNSAWIPLA